ncbi:MAG: hypothetical protein GY810_23685 [Aureispira sp.]|nr:hypothetical protein [Aureispira sp.]
MEIPYVVILVGIIVWATTQAKKTKKKILKHLDLLVDELNIELRSLAPLNEKPEWFGKFDRTISGKIEGRKISIRVFQKSSNDNDSWKIELVVACQNKHNINLQIYLTTMLTKFQKKTIGVEDIEVFQEEFDDTFVVQCNHRHFVLQMFSTDFCNQLLDVQENLLPISVTRNKVVYSGSFCLDSTHKREHLAEVAQLLQELTNLVEQWQPPYQISNDYKQLG